MPDTNIIYQLNRTDLRDVLRELLDQKNQDAEAISKVEEKPSEELLTIDQLCKLMQISRITVYNWRKSGAIPFYKLNGRVYFKKDEVLESLQKMKYSKR